MQQWLADYTAQLEAAQGNLLEDSNRSDARMVMKQLLEPDGYDKAWERGRNR